jgi:hypothetical protein
MIYVMFIRACTRICNEDKKYIKEMNAKYQTSFNSQGEGHAEQLSFLNLHID